VNLLDKWDLAYHSLGDLESISNEELKKASSWLALTTKKFIDVLTKYENML